jgi:hypothetical protein
LTTKKERIEKIRSDFDVFIKEYPITQFQPFIHGTTKKRSQKIINEKQGLRVRKEADKIIANKNNWDRFNKSDDDKVYFSTCMDRTHMPKIACERAYISDNPGSIDPILIKDFHTQNCSILKIKTPDKYRNDFVIDEDSKGVEKCIKKVFSDSNQEYYEVSPCAGVLTHMDRKLLTRYKKAFKTGGEPLAHELIDKTPKALFSIFDYGTVAINKSIRADDLKEMSSEEYNSLKDCREKYRHYFKKDPDLENLIKDHSLDGIKKFKTYKKK